MTVALTTRSRELPAAWRMADTFFRHCLVCSWIVSPAIFPVTGSCGLVPETKTRPAARTAWLYVGGGVGALGVRMMSFCIELSSAFSIHVCIRSCILASRNYGRMRQLWQTEAHIKC